MGSTGPGNNLIPDNLWSNRRLGSSVPPTEKTSSRAFELAPLQAALGVAAADTGSPLGGNPHQAGGGGSQADGHVLFVNRCRYFPVCTFPTGAAPTPPGSNISAAHPPARCVKGLRLRGSGWVVMLTVGRFCQRVPRAGPPFPTKNAAPPIVAGIKPLNACASAARPSPGPWLPRCPCRFRRCRCNGCWRRRLLTRDGHKLWPRCL